MLRFLFGGLTDRQKPGQKLFDRVVEEARRPHWYLEGQVPDTLEGRFAMLATVCALAIVRIEADEDSVRRSAAFTERFVEAMDAEHRQMGMNDPALGKRVRKLVSALARRAGEWRQAIAGEMEWKDVTLSSVYRDQQSSSEVVAYTAEALQRIWLRLERATNDELAEGQF
jgi:cytochrome b pre-mRNA-processing protein 3